MSERSFPRLAHGRPVERIGLVLRLLDHQVVGSEKEISGKVEDLVLERREGGGVAVVGLVLGTAGWAARQGGLLGEWVHAVWRLLDRAEDPRPTTLSLEHVLHLGSAVTVDDVALRHLAATSDLERWLRDHIVAPIPGSRVDGDDTPDAPRETASGDGPADEVVRTTPPDRPGRMLLSGLLGTEVVDTDGTSLGTVTEVHASSRPGPAGGDELVLVSVAHGPDLVGGRLGYDDDAHTGPLALARLVRWWHRHEQVTAWTDVLEAGEGGLRVRAGTSRPARG